MLSAFNECAVANVFCTVMSFSPLVDNEWGFNLAVNSSKYLNSKHSSLTISALLHLEHRIDQVTLSLREEAVEERTHL